MSTFGPTVAKSKNTAFDLVGIARSLQWLQDNDRTRGRDCSRSGNARNSPSSRRRVGIALRRLRPLLSQKAAGRNDGKVAYTDVACKLLDRDRCRCRRYARRHTLVPDCVALESERARVRLAADDLRVSQARGRAGRSTGGTRSSPATRRRSIAPGFPCAAARWPSATSPRRARDAHHSLDQDGAAAARARGSRLSPYPASRARCR